MKFINNLNDKQLREELSVVHLAGSSLVAVARSELWPELIK